MLGPWLPALPSIMCWPAWLILRSGSYLYLFHGRSGPKLQQPTCCICMAAGEGVERLSAVFDIVDEPAWLKCVALRFCLVAKSLFDDGKCPAETTEFKQQSGGGSSKQRSGSGQCLLQLRQQPASNAMVQMPKVTTVARPALPVAHTCRCDASSAALSSTSAPAGILISCIWPGLLKLIWLWLVFCRSSRCTGVGGCNHGSTRCTSRGATGEASCS